MRWPAGARVDHALEPGQVVSTSFDPMLGKVIVHGPDPRVRRRALVDARSTAPRSWASPPTPASCGAGRERGVRRGVDRHGMAGPARGGPARRRAAAGLRRVGERHAGGGTDAGAAFPVRRLALRCRPGADDRRADRTVVVDRYTGRVDDRAVREVSAADHVLTLEIDGQLLGRRQRAAARGRGGHRGSASFSSGPTSSATTRSTS